MFQRIARAFVLTQLEKLKERSLTPVERYAVDIVQARLAAEMRDE